MNKIIIKIILLSIIFLSACKTIYLSISEKKQFIEIEKLFDNLFENQLEYNNLSIRFSAESEYNNESDNFRGNLRIKNDSIIWISLRSYNIEGVRVVITQDSIKFMNRLNNTYINEKISIISERFGIDINYEIIQSLITNSFFTYPNMNISKDEALRNFNQCNHKKYYCISQISKTSIIRNYNNENHKKEQYKNIVTDQYITQEIMIYPDIFRIGKVNIHNITQNYSIRINYRNFLKTNGLLHPEELSLEIMDMKSNFLLSITVNNINKNNKDLNYPFSIPSNYEPIKMN